MSWPLGSYGSSAAASLLSRSKVRAGAKNLTLDRTLASLMKLCIAVQKCCGTSSKSVWQHWEHPLNPLAIVQIMTTTFHATASILNSFAQLTLKPQDSSEIRHSFEAFASRCFGSVDTASSHLTLSLPLPGFYIEDISCSKVILRTWQKFYHEHDGQAHVLSWPEQPLSSSLVFTKNHFC